MAIRKDEIDDTVTRIQNIHLELSTLQQRTREMIEAGLRELKSVRDGTPVEQTFTDYEQTFRLLDALSDMRKDNSDFVKKLDDNTTRLLRFFGWETTK